MSTLAEDVQAIIDARAAGDFSPLLPKLRAALAAIPERPEPEGLAAKLRELHKPWWEHNGVRHYQYCVTVGEPRQGHECITEGIDQCRIEDNPDDSEHSDLACVECRPSYSDSDEPGWLYWPCPTIALLDASDTGVGGQDE